MSLVIMPANSILPAGPITNIKGSALAVVGNSAFKKVVLSGYEVLGFRKVLLRRGMIFVNCTCVNLVVVIVSAGLVYIER